MKKITRGISAEFADAFKKSELFDFFNENQSELFLGVRNEYLNIYYGCDSIAKVEFKKQKKQIVCEIAGYYLNVKSLNKEDKNKRLKVLPEAIMEKYGLIKTNSYKRNTDGKKAQSRLVILNNANPKSNWFCIDVEYIKQFHNQKEKNIAGFNARFDIIAISKSKPHRVALVELKYGNKAIGGESGIYKHVSDFSKFTEKGYFEGHLKREIIEIVRSQKALGMRVPFEIPIPEDIADPEFFFITLNNNANGKASSPRQTMAAYLFKNKTWDCKRLTTGKCVETDFGDITLKSNKFHATFLFSKEDLNSLSIDDIIDGNYERIEPR